MMGHIFSHDTGLTYETVEEKIEGKGGFEDGQELHLSNKLFPM